MKFFQNYSILDQGKVGQFLFHPRPEYGARIETGSRHDFMVPVEDKVSLGVSCHFCSEQAPNILFFHGNGEIVQDYDDLGQFFSERGLNFYVADYRGYGSSSGTPSVSSMLSDSHKVLDFIINMCREKNYSGKIIVMGRSLGSAPALELAGSRQEDLSCLIIESGFARVAPLLATLGLDPQGLGLIDEEGFENLDKIKKVANPCLVIHAGLDNLIPLSEGKALYDACPASDKTFLEIKGADHNDIFFKETARYLDAVSGICARS